MEMEQKAMRQRRLRRPPFPLLEHGYTDVHNCPGIGGHLGVWASGGHQTMTSPKADPRRLQFFPGIPVIPTPGFIGESLATQSYHLRNKFRVPISGLIYTPIRSCSHHAPVSRWSGFYHNYCTIEPHPLQQSLLQSELITCKVTASLMGNLATFRWALLLQIII